MYFKIHVNVYKQFYNTIYSTDIAFNRGAGKNAKITVLGNFEIHVVGFIYATEKAANFFRVKCQNVLIDVQTPVCVAKKNISYFLRVEKK